MRVRRARPAGWPGPPARLAHAWRRAAAVNSLRIQLPQNRSVVVCLETPMEKRQWLNKLKQVGVAVQK